MYRYQLLLATSGRKQPPTACFTMATGSNEANFICRQNKPQIAIEHGRALWANVDSCARKCDQERL